MGKQYRTAILGATGAVGQEFIRLIEERRFPCGELRLLASKRTAGTKVRVGGEELAVQEAGPDSFRGIDIALFAGGSISKEFAPIAVKAGAVVIDNSSAFRMDPEVPLVVPEVNPGDIAWHKGIIANPNCSTIIMVMALKPLHDLTRIRRVVVSTYQAVSGAGKEGMAELERQVADLVAGKPVAPAVLPVASLGRHYQIAFNLLPQIDVFQPNLYTKEEMKMVDETRKILGAPEMRITATTVRVPVYRSHAESVNVEFERAITVAEAQRALAAFPGVRLVDDPATQTYPQPLATSGKDDVEVGRVRQDVSVEHGLDLWVCGDQIRKGAALNALQIAELMIGRGAL